MPKRKSTLCLEHYDCIGFDLDHTLCRYNIGPMIRLEYRLLTEFLVHKKGYDPAIKLRRYEDDQDMVCKGTEVYSYLVDCRDLVQLNPLFWNRLINFGRTDDFVNKVK